MKSGDERETLLENNITMEQENCESFEGLNQKYILLQKKYMNKFDELHHAVVSNSYRKEYSRGGVTLHRGVYSPSSLDLIIGGLSRGKILNKLSSNSKYDYEYIFDANNRLICVKKYHESLNGGERFVEIEFLVYETDRVLSFVYNPFFKNAITLISECRYLNDQLTRYESSLCSFGDAEEFCLEINIEEIGYEEGLMHTVIWHRYNPSIQLLQQNKYTFSRDARGYLSTYTIEECNNRTHNPVRLSHVYKVLVKRK